jgi:hypothetical protein
VREILHTITNVSGDDDFKQSANNAIERLAAIPGFGVAIATRLITLARPDRAVSVNNAASNGFAMLYSGLPRTTNALGNSKNCPDLLTRIYEQPWYKTPAPRDAFEQEIWSMRAALLDAFIYEPYYSKNATKHYSDDANQEVERKKWLGEQAARPCQKEFSRRIREIYEGKCALTECNTPCALQAAHICRLNGRDDNSPQNGLLLRSDIHALFDAFLITLSEDGMRVEVSDALTDPTYKFLKNAAVYQAKSKRERPSPANIQSHRNRLLVEEQKSRAANNSPVVPPTPSTPIPTTSIP